jgi:hypothetical protein
VAGEYQRRTQKGIGRTEKITPIGATKPPRLRQACNITTAIRDMREFFFISVVDEIDLNCLTLQRKTFYLNAGAFYLKIFC